MLPSHTLRRLHLLFPYNTLIVSVRMLFSIFLWKWRKLWFPYFVPIFVYPQGCPQHAVNFLRQLQRNTINNSVPDVTIITPVMPEDSFLLWDVLIRWLGRHYKANGRSHQVCHRFVQWYSCLQRGQSRWGRSCVIDALHDMVWLQSMVWIKWLILAFWRYIRSTIKLWSKCCYFVANIWALPEEWCFARFQNNGECMRHVGLIIQNNHDSATHQYAVNFLLHVESACSLTNIIRLPSPPSFDYIDNKYYFTPEFAAGNM